jgi:uncharacterized protein
MGDRCTGHCCRRFKIRMSIEEIQTAAEKPDAHPDFVKVSAMVRPLEIDPDGGWWYTCRHLQPNGDCGIYESRPLMCSDYPYNGGKCEFEGCTWDEKAPEAQDG